MKRLCELVDIVENNENCVVFKVKDDTVMDLIALGCFKGTEDMLRMTKGRTPEITVFNKDGSNYSYHFGEGSTTVISDNMMQQREMIRECAILNFGIVCDLSHMTKDVDDEGLIRTSLGVRGVDEGARTVFLVSGGGMTGHIKVNAQTMVYDINVNDVSEWFEKRGYKVSFPYDITNGLPCGRVNGVCEPVVLPEQSFDINDISKERFSVLLNNAIKLIDENHINCTNLYEVLSSELGMSDDEIKAIGYGDYIVKDKKYPIVEYNEQGKEIYREEANGYWVKRDYDEFGRQIYWETNSGGWAKHKFDDAGNEIYYENSDGFWSKSEYSKNGFRTYYEDSNGKVVGEKQQQSLDDIIAGAKVQYDKTVQKTGDSGKADKILNSEKGQKLKKSDDIIKE